jgi:hypothetical protein
MRRMKRAGDVYRTKAQECRERAELATSQTDRERWLKLALEWARLGENVDRTLKD